MVFPKRHLVAPVLQQMHLSSTLSPKFDADLAAYSFCLLRGFLIFGAFDPTEAAELFEEA